jgi:hypothetical protein
VLQYTLAKDQLFLSIHSSYFHEYQYALAVATFQAQQDNESTTLLLPVATFHQFPALFLIDCGLWHIVSPPLIAGGVKNF